MIVVRVELHSAVTGETTELARMTICNDGSGTHTRGNYLATTFKGRKTADLDRRIVQRTAGIADYPRLSLHVWNLVARALKAMRYNE